MVGPITVTSMLSRAVGWGWGGWHKGSKIRKTNYFAGSLRLCLGMFIDAQWTPQSCADASKKNHQKLEKTKIFRGKPPVMSGEVYRCPMDSPELCGGLEKKSPKNRNMRKGSGRPGGGRVDIGGTLAPHTDASNPQKLTFFHISNFDKF